MGWLIAVILLKYSLTCAKVYASCCTMLAPAFWYRFELIVKNGTVASDAMALSFSKSFSKLSNQFPSLHNCPIGSIWMMQLVLLFVAKALIVAMYSFDRKGK